MLDPHNPYCNLIGGECLPFRDLVAGNRKLKEDLRTWQDGCSCTDKSKADVLSLRARVAELDCRIIDLENTVNAIADPWDYETGLEKTAESCRAIATDCVARLNL